MTEQDAPSVAGVRFEWERSLRMVHLPAITKAVGLMLATYARGSDGGNAYPGEARLADDLGITPRTVRTHLKTLRDAGLIERTYRGRSNQYGGTSDTYRLVPHVDLDRVTVRSRSVGLRGPRHRSDGSSRTDNRHRNETVAPPDARNPPQEAQGGGPGVPVPSIKDVIKESEHPPSNNPQALRRTTGEVAPPQDHVFQPNEADPPLSLHFCRACNLPRLRHPTSQSGREVAE